MLFEENNYSLFEDLEDSHFILSEGVVVKSDSVKIKAVIEVYPMDARFANDPYFKISLGTNKWAKTHPDRRNRISILGPRYVEHRSDPGNWILNSKERKLLVADLSSSYSNDEILWQRILNKIYEDSNHTADFRNIKMPDYTKL